MIHQQKNHQMFKDWSDRFQSLSERKKTTFSNELDKIFPSKLARGIKSFKKGMASDVTDDNEPKNISDENQDSNKKE